MNNPSERTLVPAIMSSTFSVPPSADVFSDNSGLISYSASRYYSVFRATRATVSRPARGVCPQCKYRKNSYFVALSIVERDRDLLIADDVLQGLKKEELKFLFGLNHLTVKNKYDSTRVSAGIVYWKNGYLRTIVYW